MDNDLIIYLTLEIPLKILFLLSIAMSIIDKRKSDKKNG